MFAAGYGTPQKMRQASWQDRVDALGRGHYRRYDERTATMLADAAGQLLKRWHGDLRRLRDEAHGRPTRIHGLLTEFQGIGPIGADIFLREVQLVWPALAPYADQRVTQAAKKIGLPPGAEELAGLAKQPDELARLFSALVRISRSPRATEEIRQAGRSHAGGS